MLLVRKNRRNTEVYREINQAVKLGRGVFQRKDTLYNFFLGGGKIVERRLFWNIKSLLKKDVILLASPVRICYI